MVEHCWWKSLDSLGRGFIEGWRMLCMSYLKNLTSIQGPLWTGRIGCVVWFSGPLLHLDVKFNWGEKREGGARAFAICLSVFVTICLSVFVTLCLWLFICHLSSIYLSSLSFSSFCLSLMCSHIHINIHTPKTASQSTFGISRVLESGAQWLWWDILL